MKLMTLFTISGLLCLVLVFNYASAFYSDQAAKQEGQQEALMEVAESDESDLPEQQQDLAEEFSLLDSSAKEAQATEEAGIVPATLEIPAIDVTAPVETVGVLENGQMGVPAETKNVGWFEPGFRPGTKGNAVLAGHVDSKTGPAVFYHLEDLQPGDEIVVNNENGESLTFTVQDLTSYPRNEAPIEEIFGNTDGRYLNLITCVGTFDQSAGTHDKRLVVRAELNEESAEPDTEPPAAPENVEISGNFVTWHAVRDENIAGYRVYRSEDDGEFEHVASISEHERKTYTDEEATEHRYYITAVNLAGQESEPSEIAGD
ncbi:class F sortase [Lentibacillus sediminis]|uniref:class F sortase n=1 Tax=Lentibacillus sediminis TaxID=1940529 RepID=UPI000C1C0261|nr:sortase [Lentibacillus sediminis]